MNKTATFSEEVKLLKVEYPDTNLEVLTKMAHYKIVMEMSIMGAMVLLIVGLGLGFALGIATTH